MADGFEFPVFYSSLFVGGEVPDMPQVEKEHWDQGFYWFPHHVCFLLPTEFVTIEASVVDRHSPLEDEALRAIEMPLSVGDVIAVDTLPDHGSGVPLDVPRGEYSLRFVLLPGSGSRKYERDFRVRLTFLPMEAAPFAILRTGHDGMTATEVLLQETHVDLDALKAIAVLQLGSGNREFMDDLVRRGVLPPIGKKDE